MKEKSKKTRNNEKKRTPGVPRRLKELKTRSSLLVTPAIACPTSLPSPHCCSPSLMGEGADAATDAAHFENINIQTCALQVNKKHRSSFAQSMKATQSPTRSVREDVRLSLPPAVEDLAPSASSSLLLTDSPSTDTGHCRCALPTVPHCHAAFNLSTTLIVCCFAHPPQSLGLATGARMANVDRHL